MKFRLITVFYKNLYKLFKYYDFDTNIETKYMRDLNILCFIPEETFRKKLLPNNLIIRKI